MRRACEYSRLKRIAFLLLAMLMMQGVAAFDQEYRLREPLRALTAEGPSRDSSDLGNSADMDSAENPASPQPDGATDAQVAEAASVAPDGLKAPAWCRGPSMQWKGKVCRCAPGMKFYCPSPHKVKHCQANPRLRKCRLAPNRPSPSPSPEPPKADCQPGYVYNTELKMCMACPKGTYQKNDTCVLCPKDKPYTQWPASANAAMCSSVMPPLKGPSVIPVVGDTPVPGSALQNQAITSVAQQQYTYLQYTFIAAGDICTPFEFTDGVTYHHTYTRGLEAALQADLQNFKFSNIMFMSQQCLGDDYFENSAELYPGPVWTLKGGKVLPATAGWKKPILSALQLTIAVVADTALEASARGDHPWQCVPTNVTEYAGRVGTFMARLQNPATGCYLSNTHGVFIYPGIPSADYPPDDNTTYKYAPKEFEAVYTNFADMWTRMQQDDPYGSAPKLWHVNITNITPNGSACSMCYNLPPAVLLPEPAADKGRRLAGTNTSPVGKSMSSSRATGVDTNLKEPFNALPSAAAATAPFPGRMLLAMEAGKEKAIFNAVHAVHGHVAHKVLTVLDNQGIGNYTAVLKSVQSRAASINDTFSRRLKQYDPFEDSFWDEFTGRLPVIGEVSEELEMTMEVGEIGALTGEIESTATVLGGPIGAAIGAVILVTVLVFTMCGVCRDMTSRVFSGVAEIWNTITCAFRSCPDSPHVKSTTIQYQDTFVPCAPQLLAGVCTITTNSLQMACQTWSDGKVSCSQWHAAILRDVDLTVQSGDPLVPVEGSMKCRTNDAGQCAFTVSNAMGVAGQKGEQLLTVVLATFDGGFKDIEYYRGDIIEEPARQQGGTIFWIKPVLQLSLEFQVATYPRIECGPFMTVRMRMEASSLYPSGLAAAARTASALLKSQLVVILLPDMLQSRAKPAHQIEVKDFRNGSASTQLYLSDEERKIVQEKGLIASAYLTPADYLTREPLLQWSDVEGTNVGAAQGVIVAPAPQYQLQPNDTLDSVAAKFYSYPICILHNNRIDDIDFQNCRSGNCGVIYNKNCLNSTLAGPIILPPQLLNSTYTKYYKVVDAKSLQLLVANTVPLHGGLYTLYEIMWWAAKANVDVGVQVVANFYTLMFAVMSDANTAEAFLRLERLNKELQEYGGSYDFTNQASAYRRMIKPGTKMQYRVPGIKGILPPAVLECYAGSQSVLYKFKCLGLLGSQYLAATAIECPDTGMAPTGNLVTYKCLGFKYTTPQPYTPGRRLLSTPEPSGVYYPQDGANATFETVDFTQFEPVMADTQYEPSKRNPSNYFCYGRDGAKLSWDIQPAAQVCAYPGKVVYPYQKGNIIQGLHELNSTTPQQEPKSWRNIMTGQILEDPFGWLLGSTAATLLAGAWPLRPIWQTVRCGMIGWSKCWSKIDPPASGANDAAVLENLPPKAAAANASDQVSSLLSTASAAAGDAGVDPPSSDQLALYFPDQNEPDIGGENRLTLIQLNTDSEVDGWDTKSVEMTQNYIRINEPLSVYSPWVQRDGPPDAWLYSKPKAVHLCLNPGVQYKESWFNQLRLLAQWDLPICFTVNDAHWFPAQNKLLIDETVNLVAYAFTVKIKGTFWFLPPQAAELKGDDSPNWPRNADLYDACNTWQNAKAAVGCTDTCALTRFGTKGVPLIPATGGNGTTVYMWADLHYEAFLNIGPLQVSVHNDTIGANPLDVVGGC